MPCWVSADAESDQLFTYTIPYHTIFLLNMFVTHWNNSRVFLTPYALKCILILSFSIHTLLLLALYTIEELFSLAQTFTTGQKKTIAFCGKWLIAVFPKEIFFNLLILLHSKQILENKNKNYDCSPVIDWWPVKIVPHLSPNDSGDRLQHPVTLKRTSG